MLELQDICFRLFSVFLCLFFTSHFYLSLINSLLRLVAYSHTVCVGEEGNHAVVERLEATQVDRCSFCPGAVLGTGGQQGWHPFHLLQLL